MVESELSVSGRLQARELDTYSDVGGSGEQADGRVGRVVKGLAPRVKRLIAAEQRVVEAVQRLTAASNKESVVRTVYTPAGPSSSRAEGCARRSEDSANVESLLSAEDEEDCLHEHNRNEEVEADNALVLVPGNTASGEVVHAALIPVEIVDHFAESFR